MKIRSRGIAELDAFGERPDARSLSALWDGEIAAVRVRNLVSVEVCQQLTSRLLASQMIEDHADVKGLRVLGLSHFQAARDAELAHRYHDEARTSSGFLRALASPQASPFDSAMAFLAQMWPFGCQLMELPTEGLSTPFTIRIYGEGVDIEPHQDILSAESPKDPFAKQLTRQFGANIYISMGQRGGTLDLFDTDYAETTYTDLAYGPRVVSRDSLGEPVRITPMVGELILLSSHRIHAVAAPEDNVARITISFFVGLRDDQSPCLVWA